MRLISGTTVFVALGNALLRSAEAQVTTNCNPLKGVCPNDQGLAKNYYSIDFTSTSKLPSEWVVADDEKVGLGKDGAEFTFVKRYDAPTMSTNFSFFFGRVEYVVKAAAGQGIVSSMVLLSDDLDEVDWEFRGGVADSVQTNYFGKGYTGTYNRSTTPSVTSPQTSFHTYAVDWSPQALAWSIDGKTVRTLKAADADGNGSQYPQTPMKVSLSLWDGGDPAKDPATIEWAGGETDVTSGHAYTMYVSKVSIWNANPAQQYLYTDKSGSWKSIQCLNETMNAPAVQPNRTQTLSLGPSSMMSNHSRHFNHSSPHATGKAPHYKNSTFHATMHRNVTHGTGSHPISATMLNASAASNAMAHSPTGCITTVITSNGIVTTKTLSSAATAASNGGVSAPSGAVFTKSNSPLSTGSLSVSAAVPASPASTPCTTCKTVLITSNSVVSTSTVTVPVATTSSVPAAAGGPSSTCITTLVTTNGVVSVETLTMTATVSSTATVAPSAATFSTAAAVNPSSSPAPVAPSAAVTPASSPAPVAPSAAVPSGPSASIAASSSTPTTTADAISGTTSAAVAALSGGNSISIVPLTATSTAIASASASAASNGSSPTTFDYSTVTDTMTSTNTYTWTAPYPYPNGTKPAYGTGTGTAGMSGTAPASVATGSAYYPAQTSGITYASTNSAARSGRSSLGFLGFLTGLLLLVQ